MDGFEARARAMGYRTVAGVDEAGRGPLAGPVVAAAVILPPGFDHPGVRDSKALSPAARDRAFCVVAAEAVSFAVAHASPEEIDAVNILRASLLAMRRAVEALSPAPGFVFVDGHIPIPPPESCPARAATKRARRRRKTPAAESLFGAAPGLPGCVFAVDAGCGHAGRPVPDAPTVWCAIGQEAVISGDSLCRSIMAASILAKVTRDRMMAEYDLRYPGYGFASHKGYPTGEHFAALSRLGPSPIHRKTFRGVVAG